MTTEEAVNDIELIEEVAALLRHKGMCKAAKGLVFLALYAQVFQEPPPIEMLSFFKKRRRTKLPQTKTNQTKHKQV